MIKRWLGIDGVDFVIQAAITICVAIVLSAASRPNEEILVSSTFAASFAVLGYRRHWAAKRGELGKPAQPPSGEYVLELEQRVADLEAAQQRVYELEERVDFAERLLSQQSQRSPERIPEAR
jgi:hypothetical protein